ncbi:hypothetical protein PENTCL1PPCAC_19632, partial [Pristionchus entomophagus]
HLTQSKGFNAAKKLFIADQYRIDSLREHCLQSFASFADLSKELKLAPECANFSRDVLRYSAPTRRMTFFTTYANKFRVKSPYIELIAGP